MSTFQPDRIQRSATLNLAGDLGTVFPLFGPVREKDWAYGWDPTVLFPESGIVEQGMVFTTRPSDEPGNYHWIITIYEPAGHRIVYTVVATGRIWFISITCRPGGSGTLATVTYTYTGLTAEGSARNAEALAKMFESDLADWQAAINHYLMTGKILTPEESYFRPVHNHTKS